MDRAKLKTYAPQARRDFIQAMKARASLFGITEKGTTPATMQGDLAFIQGVAHPKSTEALRQRLAKRIETEGFEQVMEAMAHTWFNRFAALRFMELHGYLEHGYRVLSNPEGRATPEILEQAEHVDLPALQRDRVVDLKLEGKEQELYRLLLVAQCNALHQAMPFLFEAIEDETELLLPDNLLHSDSLISKLVANLDAEDCETVEVLGWLYQFYIAEKKDTVMARKSAVPTDDIPAVTQLFTPHWIVRYLVENSLGRLWLLNRPGSRLREQMPYYIEGEPETDFLKISNPEEIKVLDPAVGSGHMLTYAFDLLFLMYKEEGYAPNTIPALILRHNLHGLDLCPRATQLAGLALVFKAREKARRFFQAENLVQPKIIELRDVRFAENELHDYIQALGLGDVFNGPMLKLLHQFEEAKTFGSLIRPCLDEKSIVYIKRAIEANSLGEQLFLRETHLKVLRLLDQAKVLTRQYHVVVANPPYMGRKGMNPPLAALLDEGYAEGKADLMTAFIIRGRSLILAEGLFACITLDSWMFLSSYFDLRAQIIKEYHFDSLLHIGWNCFPEGHVYNRGVAFVMKNRFATNVKSRYVSVSDVAATVDKETLFLERLTTGVSCYTVAPHIFNDIPGMPIVYWASKAVVEAFSKGVLLGSFADIKRGMTTSENARFLRHWSEVSDLRSCKWAGDQKAASASGAKWFPYSKGGGYRKWFGYSEYYINWEEAGRDVINFAKIINKSYTRTIVNIPYYFRPSVTFSYVTSGPFSMRWLPEGHLYDSGGPGVFADAEKRLFILACLNSKPTLQLLKMISPTINLQIADIERTPIPTSMFFDSSQRQAIAELVENCVSLARADWDNFEASWDFRDHPLKRVGILSATLEASWRNWEVQSIFAVRAMQKLETENNRLFIAAYGLQEELEATVPEEQITLARADARKDAASFLSYAIGCMMGRYSLDKPGLVYAHAGNEYFEPNHYATFPADEDGIVPVTEFAWFPDDAATRFEAFVKTLWPTETLEQNLAWVAESLDTKKDETPRETIRRYFATGLYKDHLQTYKKRPIYWLFSSGKERAFQALVYLHRYNEGTLARMRTEYVIPLQGRISGRIEQLREDIARATSTAHSKTLQKELDTLRKQQVELHTFDEKLRHYADLRISLDLDDGVKVNYAKFGDLLAEAKAITGGKDEE